MNRRGFLKRIGQVSAATIVMPSVLAIETPAHVVVEQESAVKLGEGLWTQLQRGNIIKYNAGGITREHIKEAVEHVFSQPMEQPDRQITFRTTSIETMKEFDRIFKEEVNKGWPIAALM